MSRRDDFLREMGLGPVWLLRSRDGEARGAESGGPPARPPGQERSPVACAPRTTPAPAGATAPASRDDVIVVDRPAKEDAQPRLDRIARMDWAELKSSVSDCPACGLCKTRTRTVFGVGSESADWMVIGEAPGSEEDARGEPFVGQAGRLLDSMLAAVALKRGENVYIANVLKCRPPGNRNPDPAEVAECTPYLVRQIQLVQPKLILAMGRFAAQTLLDTDASIASMRGRLYRYQGVPTIVTYHPAYLLRNLPDKAKSWEDLCFARKTFASLAAA